MSARDSPEALIRIGCGAFIGLTVGFIIVAATLSFYASSIEVLLVVGLSMAVCVVVAWRFGDQVYRSLSKWLRRF
jgi:ABC-type antimicrobial peptide transport system permease subunit